MYGRIRFLALVAATVGLLVNGPVLGASPAQRLPSALLIFPLIDVEGGGQIRDTRVELLNLTGREQRVSCFYIGGARCTQVGFFLTLTANQPMSWLVSKGTFNAATFSAVPPFHGTGELKCAVLPREEDVAAHNAIQGRAIVFGADGQTAGYGAVGFQRLSAGEFSGLAELDGATYAQCPDEMHFVFVASEAGAESEIVITPCSEDLENRTPTETTVQFLVFNEFEQVLSASTTVRCTDRRSLEDISSVFNREVLGTDTGHVIVTGVQTPVLAMLIDRFVDDRFTVGTQGVAANEPALRGGRPATIRFP